MDLSNRKIKIYPIFPNRIVIVLSLTQLRLITARIIIISIVVFYRRYFDHFDHVISRKNKVPFGMAIGNEQLMQEDFPKHSSMGTVRMKDN